MVDRVRCCSLEVLANALRTGLEDMMVDMIRILCSSKGEACVGCYCGGEGLDRGQGLAGVVPRPGRPVCFDAGRGSSRGVTESGVQHLDNLPATFVKSCSYIHNDCTCAGPLAARLAPSISHSPSSSSTSTLSSTSIYSSSMPWNQDGSYLHIAPSSRSDFRLTNSC